MEENTFINVSKDMMSFIEKKSYSISGNGEFYGFDGRRRICAP